MKNVESIQLEAADMKLWPNGKKQVRGRNVAVKLASIVCAKFCAGRRELLYKTHFEDETFQELEFLQKKHQLQIAPSRSGCRGIPPSKKAAIVHKLCRKMPVKHRSFWHNLPESDSANDLCTEIQ